MNLFEASLFQLTNVLLVPVVVSLACLCAWTLVMFGGFLRECLARRSPDATSARRLDALLADRGAPGMLGRFARTARTGGVERAQLENAALRCQTEASRRVARCNLVARAGPTLGLMATLIPMGPALMALADDDVSGLARSLVVAFTATVCGLLVGLLCSTMGSVRRHWYADDLAVVDEVLGDSGEARA